MKKEYPIIDVPASGNPRWDSGARTMCFVYSKYNGNFILRGYLGEVKEYLKKNYTHYFYYQSMWFNGKSRGHWIFWKTNVGIFQPSLNRFSNSKIYDNKYEIRYYSNFFDDELSVDEKKVLKFKRLPKRWIKEFDQF